MGAAPTSQSLGQEMFPVSLALGQGLVHALWRLQAGRQIGRVVLVPAWPGHAQQRELPVGTALRCVGAHGRGPGPATASQTQPALSLRWPGQLPARLPPESGQRGPGGALGSKSQPLSEEAGGGARQPEASQLQAPEPDVTLTLNGKSSPE